ncbi:MAG: bifunctional oligoribonuclease/PAP phosphatase NrnA [Saprospiraceae bacterium]
MEGLNKLKDILKIPTTIAIIVHRNPDGDALGSGLGLALFLKKKGHSVQVILPSEYPPIFEFLPTIKDTIVFDLNPQRTVEILTNAELIFCLDFNSLDRIEKIAPILLNLKKKTYIMIDHHLDPEPFADYVLSEPEASSTSELIFDFIQKLDEKKRMDVDIGTCLFTGIITDTGSFKYATNPNTYHVAAELKKLGVDDYQLQDNIFNAWTERQMVLLGHCLRNRMEIIPEYATGIIYLDASDYKKYQISRGDTEGVVNYILMIKGIKVALFIRDMHGSVRMSLRSKGSISVQDIARNHFRGGGHKNASGGSSKESIPKTIETFKSILPKYIDKIKL